MKNPTPTKFEVTIYGSATEDTHVSILWSKGKKTLAKAIKFEKIVQAKEVDLEDGKTYIISFDSQRKERVRISLLKDFKVTPCIVTVKEKESQFSL